MQLSQEGALGHRLVQRLPQGFSVAVLNRTGDISLIGGSEPRWTRWCLREGTISLYSMAGSLWSPQVSPVAISPAPEATREHSLSGGPDWSTLMGADIN